jgi:hypothetical protein
MRFGIHLPHAGERATPALIRRFATQAEAIGIADVWVSEHIILPRTQFLRPLPYLRAGAHTHLGRRRHRARQTWHVGFGAADAPPNPAGEGAGDTAESVQRPAHPRRRRGLAGTRVRRPRRCIS